MTNLAAFEEALERAIAEGIRTAADAGSRYWYPLSMPTYGASEVLEAVDSMVSMKTSMGEKTRRFEELFAAWQGGGGAVMVNSGSSADLLLCLLLTNPLRPLVRPGAEVLVPVVTWPTQAWAAMMAGLRVRFVDVDPETLNADPEDMEAAVGPSTEALFLVHLMGNPCDMEHAGSLANRRGLHVLEDCCEAMGATWDGKRVGTFGIGGTFSFFFSHHITCMEGGMISFGDAHTGEHLRLLRAHGWVRNVDPASFELEKYPDVDPRYAFVNWGLNVRPTEVQAGFGIHQLQKADAFGKRRAVLAERFHAFIGGTGWLSSPRVHPRAQPSWFALPVMVSEAAPFTRRDLTAYLEAEGVETRPIVTGNIARHPVARLFPELRERPFPGADAVHFRGFYIGLSPMLPDASMDRLLETFARFLARY